MEKSLLRLKCRNCESIVEITSYNQENKCNCGNCRLGLKEGIVYIGSKNGLGDYLIYNGDKEYILISRQELEGNNG